jgi:hypothetical protein
MDNTGKKKVTPKKKGDTCVLSFNKEKVNLIEVTILDPKTKRYSGRFSFDLTEVTLYTLDCDDIGKQDYYLGVADRIRTILMFDLEGSILNISLPILKLSGFISKELELNSVVANSNAFSDAGKELPTSYSHISDKDIYQNLASKYSGSTMVQLTGQPSPIVGFIPANNEEEKEASEEEQEKEEEPILNPKPLRRGK